MTMAHTADLPYVNARMGRREGGPCGWQVAVHVLALRPSKFSLEERRPPLPIHTPGSNQLCATLSHPLGMLCFAALCPLPPNPRPPPPLCIPALRCAGVAPFRSFLQHRRNALLEIPTSQDAPTTAPSSQDAPAPSYLFFGCRNESKDFFYREEWDEYRRRGVLAPQHGLVTAFSRDQKEKVTCLPAFLGVALDGRGEGGSRSDAARRTNGRAFDDGRMPLVTTHVIKTPY